MKQFAEFLPIAVFAGVYFYTKDIFLSTGVLMAGVALQFIYEFATTKSVSKQTQFIFGSVIILGGFTLVFRDEVFIQWKPTIVNWVFSIVLIGSQLVAKKNPLKQILGSKLPLPDAAWKTLTYGWSLGFFINGALNLVVAYNFSMDFWVSYKLIGGFGLTIIYIVIMFIYLAKGGYLEDMDTKNSSADVK